MSTRSIASVVIIGGGFSGALFAVNLLRHGGPRAILIERRSQVARGVAYSAPDPALLLNVRASNMSALPDRPNDFVEWLGRRGILAEGFVPRATYGEYLAELLEETWSADRSRLELISGDAIAADEDGDEGMRVRLADGRSFSGDAVVLASGNLPPTTPPGLDPDRLPASIYVGNPWGEALASGLKAADTVLILGTGLTMIDAVLLLEERGFRGRIVALSRHGLLPRHHAGGMASPGLSERPPVDPSRLLVAVRARAEAVGWRAAVDELRPYTRSLWLAASIEGRSRFLRHLRPWWDVHRHRIAPQVAERIAALRSEGRLRIVTGRTLGFAAEGDRVRMSWRPRGGERSEDLLADRIVNCTGPQVDLDRSSEPLLQSLRSGGLIVPDPMRLGMATDAVSRAIDSDGNASDKLYALGPLTKGTFWEIVAVPDIREQAWTLARRLSHAQWVGGEGL
jgi:uncharacterized NAD(P)/FAD-binding protein YdhS